MASLPGEPLPRLPPRRAESHKGDFGRVLVIAGSRGMAGAAGLCGMAALRGGAGLVQVACPAEVAPIVAGFSPCYTTAYLPQDEQGKLAAAAADHLIRLAEAWDVLAVGPGLGQGPQLDHVIRRLLQETAKPMVLDADGLNALARLLPELCLARRAGPLILTPHPGEFARLLRKTVADVQRERARLATDFAAEHRVVLVLKGSGSLVADGCRWYKNLTGNPGMASGGTGDVLTGLIGALLGQGLPPFEAAQLAVHWHGLAGDLARKAKGETALIASDLLDHLPLAIDDKG